MKKNIERYLGSGINMFFENVLELFDTIRNEYRNMSTRKIQLKSEQNEDAFLNIDTSNPDIVSILNYMAQYYGHSYQILEDNAGQLNLRVTFSWKHFPSGTLDFGNEHLRVNYVKGKIDKYLNSVIAADINDVLKLKKILMDFFRIETKIISEATRWERYFPDLDDIEKCVNLFYMSLKYIMSCKTILEISDIRKNVLIELLKIGSYVEDRKYKTTIYSPRSMIVLPDIYRNLAYYLSITESDNILEKCNHSIFLSKIHQSNRWYSVISKDQLYHVALPAYQIKQNTDMFLQMRNIKEYDSYEGVGELRLADKLLYELKYRYESKMSIDGIRVSIFGEVNFNPMIELVGYINKAVNIKYTKIRGKYSFLFKIYTRKKEAIKEEQRKILYKKCELEFCEIDKDQFKNIEKLKALVNDSDMIFLLDNSGIYDNLTYRNYEDKYNCFEEFQMLTNHVDVKNKRANFEIDKNFDELYNVAVTYSNFEKIGKIYKKASEGLLKQLQKEIGTLNDEKIIYAYISDLAAFSEVYCNRQEYVRLEQYRDKYIGIIRLSRRNKLPLEINSKSKMIVFNLWQFVKHIAIQERRFFEDYFIQPSYKGKVLLDQILIGIDYSLWLDELVFSYTLDSKTNINKVLYCERIEQFINNIMIPKFDSENDDIYEDYYRKAFVSFLYGDAKSVEDMLFIHIYQWHKVILGKSRLEKNNVSRREEILRNKNVNYIFSTKRFYQITMENFDSTFHNEFDRLKAYGTLRRDVNLFANANEKEETRIMVFNIQRACENITYDKSILYRQCTDYLLKHKGE